MHAKGTALGLVLFLLTSTVASAGPMPGKFALQGGVAKTNGHLVPTRLGSDPLHLDFDVWLTPRGSSAPIRTYDLDMTKFLHLIVVSDDFRSFFHLHPALRANGHFALNARLPRAGVYHVYADAVPQGFGQQVFRFDVVAGKRGLRRPRDLSERGRTVTVGPYALMISGESLRAGTEGRLLVRVMKAGRPATDLRPYLGAVAHAVFLNAENLGYAHVHPMAASQNERSSSGAMTGMTMSGADSGPAAPVRDSASTSPTMQLHVALREPGTYKLWLQFRGGAHLYVAPFVVRVR
jgi:hypothetical protein